ncbi:uncharacterized protein LOC132751709 [Ruditapes philippinarum]|uniref:uncharacterized protein LOC132751709 n=1 Tax=Ruditapes philippinarum TaxID=129788 RepID=UPI00295B6DCD|nr:uncharacterized protein LOC132751709 [Ruditapes philippinarum]
MTSPLSPGIVPENVDTKTISKPFTESGKCKDEVMLTFDDGQILFVSQNFLILTSPVFEAMLCGDFKETQTRNVDLKEKKYDSFLEFLMCIHPGTTTTVNRDNVLDIMPIAEEYQVTRILCKCKICLKKWLTDELETARKGQSIDHFVIPARNCLYILKTVAMLNYSELIELCVGVVSQFGHRIFFGSYSPNTIKVKKLKVRISDKGKFTTVEEIISECTEVFKSLQADVKYDVLARRLALYPDNDFKVPNPVEFGPPFFPVCVSFPLQEDTPCCSRYRDDLHDHRTCSQCNSRYSSRSRDNFRDRSRSNEERRYRYRSHDDPCDRFRYREDLRERSRFNEDQRYRSHEAPRDRSRSPRERSRSGLAPPRPVPLPSRKPPLPSPLP